MSYKTKYQLEQERKYFENQQNYINRLQRHCMPGQHLLTCPTCGRIGVFPTSQIMVSCVSRGSIRPRLGGIGNHPGMIYTEN